MIHIKKSKDNQYYVAVTAPNGKTLSQSETFKTKQSAFKNISAQAEAFNVAATFIVIDETLKKPVRYTYQYWDNKKHITP